jgi:hypothetical protein
MGLGDAHALDVKLPAVLPALGAYLVSAHCNHPSGRHAIRLIVSRTTPGEMMLWRGMSAVCPPQEHPQVVCRPVSLFTSHPCARSARFTSRSLMAFVTKVNLARLYVNLKMG